MSPRTLRASLENDRRANFIPNAKQWEWCTTHAVEALLSGPNQHGGKTYTERFLIATHATGDYDENWTGPRFDEPPLIVVVSPTLEGNRDQIVHHLFAELFDMQDMYGPGWIRPYEYDVKDFELTTTKPSNSVATARVTHLGPDRKPNGKSLIIFTSYTAGIRRIAGLTANIVFGNELPPTPVYSEMKARINATLHAAGGILRLVGCPTEEDPEVYYMFKQSADPKVMQLIDYSITDCAHIPEDVIQSELIRWQDHPQAEARLHGRPWRGSGLVFPYARPMFTCPASRPSDTFHRIIGLDLPLVGGVFAAIAMAWDKDTDRIFVYDEYADEAQEWPVYAHRVRLMGGDVIPCAWPKDGGIRVSSSASETRSQRLRSLGLRMLPEPAYFWDGSVRSDSKLAMIEEVRDRITTGRLKISQACSGLLDEMRVWKQKDDKIKKGQVDHKIDAMLKGLMMKRYAEQVAAPGAKRHPWSPGHAAPPDRREYDFYGTDR